MVLYNPNGTALIKLIIHNVAIIRTARLKPLIAYRCNGKHMAKNRSVENATIVSTETYVDLWMVQYEM